MTVSPGLERLAQRVEHARLELGQLVEEQHAEVREAHLAGARPRAAADERRHAGGVVRRAERPASLELAAHQLAGEAVHHRDLEHLLGRQRRQDRGQPRGEHRLAGARRADHQEVVAAGGGDLEHALGALLAFDVARDRAAGRCSRSRLGLGRRERLQAFEVIDEREQMRRREDVDVLAGPGGLRAAGVPGR